MIIWNQLGSLSPQKVSDNPHECGSLLQERRVGGTLEFVVLNVRDAVEEGLNNIIFRNVVFTSVDHQGRDLDLRESIDYAPCLERTGPARLQISF